MKKRLLILPLVLALIISSCRRENDSAVPLNAQSGDVLKQKINPVGVPQGDVLTASELNKTIVDKLREKKDFHWQWVDLKTLWSALANGDHVAAVGYKPADAKDIEQTIAKIDVHGGTWKAVHDAIIKLVLDELNKNSAFAVKASDVIVEDDEVLPIITFRLTDRNVITKLYNLENVRYIEPIGYFPPQLQEADRSASGCSGSSEPLNSADWTTILPNCLMPWNYNNLNIPTAWNTAQGAGIKIGIIDAGISTSQSLFGNLFTNGYSNVNRTVTTAFTYGSSAYTSCAHGTSMSGLAVGPRNDQNATSGIAYQSSLYFIRGCNDVVLDESAELLGVKNALVKMGKDQKVKLVSMSVGTPFYSSTLYDGVSYAYSKGKMLFAAAGTSFSFTTWWGVIYPAAFSQCIAVTGVKENGSTCTVCHDGSQVKFTVPMERDANENRNSLSLPVSGTTPSYIGGSSAATATAAGIAALVWSVKPTLTRDNVYTILRNTSQFYPSVTSNHGYGNLNASAAVVLAQTY